MGYASVVKNLFHKSCRLVEAPDSSFTVGLLFMSTKGYLQSISQASQRDLSTCINGIMTGQSARVKTRKGSETLTIVCRVEVTARIVCVK